MPISKLFFDKQDKTLLLMANKVLAKQRLSSFAPTEGPSTLGAPSSLIRKLFDANLHPHGIKEMAISHELRVAYAVMNLLDSLEAGHAEDRLLALTALRDEVLSSAQSSLQRNTARVLIQIMKELVRAHGDPCRQLKLAHEFRHAASGKPRIIRALLTRYHLLEMPEEWNQIAFDHHVHDASTKGRKNPTHLIMDAWVKGIRHLTVIYYNYIEPNAAKELLQAAQIMGVTVRIGVEFRVPFHGRYVDFIWIPRGFAHSQELLDFLDEPPVRHLLTEGRKASRWQERYVFATLVRWNHVHRHNVNKEFGLTLEILSRERFLRFVGTGQASLLHLAECIYQAMAPALASRVAELREELEQEGHTEERAHEAHALVERLNTLTAETILSTWLSHAANIELADPDLVPTKPVSYPKEASFPHEANAQGTEYLENTEGYMPPELLQMPPYALLDWLTSLHSDYRVILNLGGVSTADVLELLWQCGGLITHLEIFNLKDWSQSHATHLPEIGELQYAINDANMPLLKRIIQNIIQDFKANSAEINQKAQDAVDQAALHEGKYDEERIRDIQALQIEQVERITIFTTILHGMVELKDFYAVKPLRSRLGTDSTSRSHRLHGMGLVLPETLPQRTQRSLRAMKKAQSTALEQKTNADPSAPVVHHNASRQYIPIHTGIYRRESFIPQQHPVLGRSLSDWLRRLPACSSIGTRRIVEWVVAPNSIRVTKHNDDGNIVTLGKSLGAAAAHLSLDIPSTSCGKGWIGTPYLNTNLANCLKILVGFIPAMLTFHYTQTWWLLAWFGALIWFGITGVRNIVQAVLAGGGGGWRSTPLLRWNNYVSWSRMSDSLMYTGLSVPILELGMRTLLLQDTFGMNAHTHPAIVFTVIATANGLYIAAHNIYRGLQKEAVVGNMFRSVLAIPVAMFYTTVLFELLRLVGVYDPWVMLQPSTTIISKTASDTVAAIIEGFADRSSNLRMRSWDYNGKFNQFFADYAKLEVLFPEENIVELLRSPKTLLDAVGTDARHLETSIIISALDLMYFWMYQPRARHIFLERLNAMSKEEQTVLLLSQFVLTRERAVSQLFVDGLVGKHFSRPLAFYLDQRESYLRDISRLCKQKGIVL